MWCVRVCVVMWNPEVDIKCLLLWLPTVLNLLLLSLSSLYVYANEGEYESSRGQHKQVQAHQSTCVDMKTVDSFQKVNLFCVFWALNSGNQACIASTNTHWAIFLALCLHLWISQWTCRSIFQLSCLPRKCPGIDLPSSPPCWCYRCVFPRFFKNMGVGKSQLRFPCLYSNYLTHWAISRASN